MLKAIVWEWGNEESVYMAEVEKKRLEQKGWELIAEQVNIFSHGGSLIYKYPAGKKPRAYPEWKCTTREEKNK